MPGLTWDPEERAWRTPAAAHAAVRVRLTDAAVRISDEIRPAMIAGGWCLPALRWYQDEALARWERADGRGVIALPTGAGKTLTAIAAIARRGVAALVLVPTRVLLDQWARAIAAAWPHPVGRLGDGDHAVAPITIATYASAVTWAPRIGDRFGLVIVDEAHHVGGWCPAEVLEMLPAACRLGLTATPPDDRAALAAHVGPVVYARRIDELVGDGLAAYELHTLPIALTADERVRYREQRTRFSGPYAAFQRTSPGADWRAFVTAARRTPAGRAALAGWRGSRAVLAYAEGKRAVLRDLLARHAGERTLVFTQDNASAYAIARELLVMPITHEISRGERARALRRFAAGEIDVLVSAQVLDEGLDVPDAEIAIIVGGSSSGRRHVQRIGRVLRPRPGKRARVYELAIDDSAEIAAVMRRREGLTGAPGTSATDPPGTTHAPASTPPPVTPLAVHRRRAGALLPATTQTVLPYDGVGSRARGGLS